MCIATDHDPQAICPLKTARAQDTRSHPYCVNIVMEEEGGFVVFSFLDEGGRVVLGVFLGEGGRRVFFFGVCFFRVCFFLVLFFLFFLDLLYIFRVFGVCCSFLLSFCSGGVLVVFVVCEFFLFFGRGGEERCSSCFGVFFFCFVFCVFWGYFLVFVHLSIWVVFCPTEMYCLVCRLGQ